jgi:type I restriction enzyme S subunit
MLSKSVGYFNFKNNFDFYFHLLNSKNIQNYFIYELTGSTIKNLSLKTLRDTEIQLPSLPEQTKIANFLTTIDEKITKVETQIKQMELWKKGLLQQMFV